MATINAPRLKTLGIIALIILTTSSLILYLDLAERHDELAKEYKRLDEDHAKLAQINRLSEELFNLTKASIREAPRNIVLASRYSFSYYYTWDLRTGVPYICVYLPAEATFEVVCEVYNVSGVAPSLTIQKGTPYMNEPIPDLVKRELTVSYESFSFDAPSAGWYTVSLVGHVAPSYFDPSGGGSWVITGNSYHAQAWIRVLRGEAPILFGVCDGD